MPFCNIYRTRRGLFGRAILQQYFDASALSPNIPSGWRDVEYKNAPAILINNYGKGEPHEKES